MIVGYDEKGKGMRGMGGDEKKGMWMWVKWVEDWKRVKCGLLVEEEVGWIGRRDGDMWLFWDWGLVIECEGKGKGDMVREMNGMKVWWKELI